MKLSDLALLIDMAIDNRPPAGLMWWYGKYYQPYYHLMYLLARVITKGIAVELGVESGRGAVSLASARPETRVIGLDNNHHSGIDRVCGKFDNFTFLHRASMPIPAEVIVASSNGIAILHIDTEHSHAMAQAEFEAYAPLLMPGAVVLFDDLHAQEDGVLEFFETLPHPKIQEDRLHPVCGYGVLIYE